MKRTITFEDGAYQEIKEFCQNNNLKIGGFAQMVLINYIRFETKPNLKVGKQKFTPPKPEGPKPRSIKEGKEVDKPKN